MLTIKVTDSQKDMILLALKNEVRGEDARDSYDLKLKRLIKKIGDNADE